ncbi:MAG: M28 family peptidase [Candidatus Palauibacterales bacterium]|nr:M28 family peptidase [Candidatus Palauibacterales bacterium]MDP2482503.1 M28 family peptidase [Candidatus Palauibacterales bacterium]
MRMHVSGAPMLIMAAIGLGFVGCSSASAPAPELELAPVEARINPAVASETITAAEMRSHIAFLASDELAGRDTPSPGLEKAAVYIEDAFRAAGLQPAGDDGSYLQRWTFDKTSLKPDEVAVEVVEDGETTVLEYAVDFFVLPSTEEVVSGGAAFAGSVEGFLGDSAPDMQGRLAVVTTPPSMGMEILQAGRAAAGAGASGLVLILDPALPAEVVGMVAGQVAGSGLPPQPVPIVGIPWEVASRILRTSGSALEDLAGDSTAAHTPVVLDDLQLTVRTPVERETSNPPNVVGILPGSDPDLADTYVVLSAHFDHVGIGVPDAEGDSIYNGADDDASGTSVLLEVAQALQAMPRAPRRSVLFLAVSGEEKGLLGSAHFAAQPTVPLTAIIADINLDMVGRNAPDTVIAVGQEYTSLGDLSRQIAEQHPELGLTVAPDPDPSEQAFFRSDHLVFVREDIPAIFLTTWIHDDYHQPSDEVEAIDSDKAARVARLAFLLTWHVAEDEAPPEWKAGALEEVHEILEDSPL